MTQRSPSGLGRGLSVAEWSISCVNNTSAVLTRGQVACIDFVSGATAANAAAYNTGVNIDPLSSVVELLANVTTGATGSQTAAGALAVLCDEDSLAVGAIGNFWVRHPNVQARCTTGAVAGDIMCLPSATPFTELVDGIQAVADMTSAESCKIVGYAHEADTSTVIMIMFDGFSGFGHLRDPALA